FGIDVRILPLVMLDAAWQIAFVTRLSNLPGGSIISRPTCGGILERKRESSNHSAKCQVPDDSSALFGRFLLSAAPHATAIARIPIPFPLVPRINQPPPKSAA